MTLRDNDAGDVFNPATGVVTPGVPVDTPVTGIVYPVTRGRRGDGAETKKSQRVILSAEGLSVVPTVKHQLIVGGQTYEITNVNPLAPGGVDVIYELQVSL